MNQRSIILITFCAAALFFMALSPCALAQLTDVTQTPNTINAGIAKSLSDQIGTGRGNDVTPDSSLFIIKRDPFRSVVRGRQLFQRKFTRAQSLGPRTGDGIGNLNVDPSLGAGIGDSCATCHIQNLTINNDRRVADTSTEFDPQNGVFNRLYATATPLFDTTNDGSGFPDLKTPSGRHFRVRGFFADFKRHDLGPSFWERNFDGTITKKFMTEPLWGVGTTATYGHDGRSINLDSVIRRHGGEAQASSNAHKNLADLERRKILAYLGSLVIFPPPDTASNLDPKNPAAPNFPQNGHGSINLSCCSTTRRIKSNLVQPFEERAAATQVVAAAS